MKKVVILTAVVLMLSSTIAGAHPPRDMEVSYDLQEQVLLVKMLHVVRNPTDHRIARIVVTKNEEERLVIPFAAQTSARKFEESIPFEAKAGDKLTIKAICNKAGSQTVTITVEE